MLSSNEKKIQQIDSNLEHLREDLVRFYSAFSTSPKETMANVLVAYEILMANPLTTDELRKAAYKVREFTTVKAMSVFGTSVNKDSAIGAGAVLLDSSLIPSPPIMPQDRARVDGP